MDQPQRVFKLSPQVIIRPEEDGAFLFNAASGALEYANDTALALAPLLEKGATLDELAALITARYEGSDAAAARQDIELFLDQLAALGYLETAPPR